LRSHSISPTNTAPSHLAYLEAPAAAMRPEYEAIAAAGLNLQLDSPDLAMAAHSGFSNSRTWSVASE